MSLNKFFVPPITFLFWIFNNETDFTVFLNEEV